MDHVNTYKNPKSPREKKNKQDSSFKFKEIDRSKFLTIYELMDDFKVVEIDGVKVDPDTCGVIEWERCQKMASFLMNKCAKKC